MKPLSRLLTAASLAAGALLAAAPAHAVGRLVGVDVVDRDTGARLPVYHHQGDYWIAGRPGARYAVQMRNATGGRVLGVVSVDGVNVLSGDTAAWDQAGYVLSPWQNAEVTGWRKSDAEVAAFHFTALPKSYAARTGRPRDVGVIGVAVFREKPLSPPPPVYRPAPRREAPAAGESADALEREGAAKSAEAPMDAVRSSRAAPQAAPRLGTGHGERESSPVTHTRFERRAGQPDEVITLRYDSRDNLLALGVIPRPPSGPRRLDAFPESPSAGYVPDPPAWR